MKKRVLSSFISLLLLLSCLLSSCSTQLIQEEETTEENETLETLTETKGTEDPKADGVLSVLMIGNSACYYYNDELSGMAEAAGINMKVCNVYYSGCLLSQHWDWLKKDQYNYEFVTHSKTGVLKKNNYNLDLCLKAGNWDVITLQQNFSLSFASDLESCRKNCEPYAGLLISYLTERFPLSKLGWHQTWAYEIGYDQSNGRIADLATQLLYHNNIRTTSLELCDTYSLACIPSGEAWKLARESGYKNLTARKGVNGDLGDYCHDGDIGGGQYLNACVWFEVLTGQSCVGNTFRPNYKLAHGSFEELQQIAHQTVLAEYGEDFFR